MKISGIVVALVSFTLAGCVVPFRYTVAPPVSGVVVAGDSGAPIADARVLIQTPEETGLFHRDQETTTDAQGRFSIPAQHVTWIYIVPQAPYFPSAILLIDAEGFVSYVEDVVGSPLSDRWRDAVAANPHLRFGDFDYLDDVTIRLQREHP